MSYYQINRIIKIDQLIRDLGKASREKILELNGCDVKTLKSDIKFMKSITDSFVYDRKVKGYKYRSDFDLFNFANDQTLLIYLLFKEILKTENYIPIENNNILKDLESKLVLTTLKNVKDKISYILSEKEKINFQSVMKIIEALKSNTLLEIKYDGAVKETTERRIEPYHLYNYQGKWYLGAFCLLKRELRSFSLNRMLFIQNLKNKFNPESRFSKREIQEFFLDSFGIAVGKRIETAIIRFDNNLIKQLRNQKWHPKQKSKIIEISGVPFLEFSFPVSKYEELIGRVLRFSPYAEIIEPKQMRNEWLDKLKLTFRRFCDDG
ncbi:MAG: WYL domain-containing protein [Candidatus Delongbacteria bacterium]|nr:WYL domain-containing protein [Candidatus Delongbacteria bacterium]MBN2836913.1 WYL domain-containing protein [Candidatus Delongbacteria bacterium]